ncbi:MAG TPA: PQQ-binding-like beta-propeller repeat protein [Oscillospiraceae bacterium]|nr:PQQ-binding-like beta-propeller repeat protein [Oscillospiraceae bacterium]
MKNHRKKLAALLISLLMIASIFPVQVYASEEDSILTASEDMVNGTFVLVGSSLNPSPEENPYEIWLEVPFSEAAGTNAQDLTDSLLAANNYTVSYASSDFGDYLNKITPPAENTTQFELEGGVTNGSASGWMWSLNDDWAPTGASEYVVQEGDEIRWYFINDWQQDYSGHPDKFTPAEEVAPSLINPDAYAARPSYLTSWWPAFGGSMDHSSVKELPIEIDLYAKGTSFTFQKEGGWMDSFSDPLQVGDWIYVVFSDTLYKLNKDGSVNAQAKLEFMIDSTSRPAYADGLLLVPMKYGKVQALTADTLTTVWIAHAPEQILLPNPDTDEMEAHDQQSLTTLKAVNGLVYQGTCTVGWSPRSYGGSFRAISLADGSTVWEHSSTETGFYWSGAALVNGVVVVGNDMGEIFAFNAANGNIVDRMVLPLASDGLAPAIRTTMVPRANQVYFISQQDGSLHRLNVNSDGSLGALKTVKFCDGGSTASPAISDGKVYAAGPGTLSIINADTMAVEKSYEIDGAIQGTPLVVKDKSGSTYVFFTINKEPGALYGITTDGDKVHTVYTPIESQQNWCMASVSISADGNLFYSNDSHTLFAVKLAEKMPATGEYNSSRLLLSSFFFVLAASALVIRAKRKKVND